jgi:hypothetical protein
MHLKINRKTEKTNQSVSEKIDARVAETGRHYVVRQTSHNKMEISIRERSSDPGPIL